MNRKRYLLATLVGGVSMWLLAGVWHTLIMSRFYKHSAGSHHDGVGLLLIAYLVLGALMAYLYPQQEESARPMLRGGLFGVVIGLLWVFPHGLAMVGAHGGSIVYVFKNAAWHMVEQGIGGILMGLVYGWGQGNVARVAAKQSEQ